MGKIDSSEVESIDGLIRPRDLTIYHVGRFFADHTSKQFSSSREVRFKSKLYS